MPLGMTRSKLMSVEYVTAPPPIGGPPTLWTAMTQQVWTSGTGNLNFTSFSPDGNGNILTTAQRVNPANSNLRENVQITSDDGATWQAGTDNPGWASTYHQGKWYANKGTAIHSATDPLGTWTSEFSTSFDQQNIVSSVTGRMISMGGRQLFFNNTPAAIFLDNTWFKLDTKGANAQVPTGCLASDLANVTTWCNVISNSSGSGFQISTDDGVTWTQKATLGETPNCVGIHDGTIVMPCSQGYILRSVDNGDSWTFERILDHTSYPYHDIATDGLDNWLIVGHNGHAAYSADDGLTWNVLPQGLNTGDIATAALYACNYIGEGKWMAGATNGFCSIGVAE